MVARSLGKAAFLLSAALLLSACEVDPPITATQQLTFANMPAISLNVGHIEIVDESEPTGRPPHIEHDMPVAPSVAIHRWVQDRIKPIGTSNIVRIIIRKAEALEEPLPTDHGVMGIFKSEQVSRIRIAVDVSVQWLDDRSFVRADASATSLRFRTLPEGLKLNERDQILYELVEETMKSFDREIEPRIRNNLGPIIAY